MINIITKSAADTHGTLAAVGGGNVDEGSGALRYGRSFGKNADYRVYGMGFVRGQEFHSDGDPFDEWRMGQMGFRLDWNRGEQDTLTLQGDTYSGENGGETNIAFFSPPSQANVDSTSFVSGGNILARWKRRLKNGSDFQLRAYFDRTSRQNAQFGETRDTFDVDFIHHLSLPKGEDFIWGLGLRVSPANFIQTQATVNFLPHQQTDTIYSGFIQERNSAHRESNFADSGNKNRAQQLQRLGFPAERPAAVDAEWPSDILGSGHAGGAHTIATGPGPCLNGIFLCDSTVSHFRGN